MPKKSIRGVLYDTDESKPLCTVISQGAALETLYRTSFGAYFLASQTTILPMTPSEVEEWTEAQKRGRIS